MFPYHKLPNPLAPIFAGLAAIDGLDVDELLKFLGSILRIREFPGITDTGLLHMIAPYCRGLLLEILLGVLHRQGNFPLFHREVLDAFIPARLREKLRCERFYRSQDNRESLSAYVTSIKETGQVLMVTLSEAEIVEVIMDGLNRAERARLATSQIPTTFAGLNKLCITSRSVQFADEQNAEKERMQSRRQVMSIQPPVQQTPQPGNQGFVPRRPYNCYRCGGLGHFRNNCPQGRGYPQQGYPPHPPATPQPRTVTRNTEPATGRPSNPKN